MNDLSAKIEALLFLSTKPVTFKKLARQLGVKESEVGEAVEALAEARNQAKSGVHVLVSDQSAAFVTSPDLSEFLASTSKEDEQAELTRPQLETLTIIAYRGPVTKPEIEHIRGVNCSLILRNLLMRGLIDEREDEVRLTSVYSLSPDMLRHLGVRSAKELPDFGQFNQNERMDQLLESLSAEEEV